jgi:hypothetical protein
MHCFAGVAVLQRRASAPVSGCLLPLPLPLERRKAVSRYGRCRLYATLLLRRTDLWLQFPYALDVLPAFLRDNWNEPSFQPYREAFPDHARDTPEHLESYVRELTAKDLKVACLKQLQGLFPAIFFILFFLFLSSSMICVVITFFGSICELACSAASEISSQRVSASLSSRIQLRFSGD